MAKVSTMFFHNSILMLLLLFFSFFKENIVICLKFCSFGVTQIYNYNEPQTMANVYSSVSEVVQLL